MSNETEKITINLSVVELAQIDVLVDQGIFSNRSDFIRSCIRKQLETYGDRMDLQLTPVSNKDNWTTGVGIFSILKKDLEKLIQDGEKLNISVIGMLIIEASIDVELFKKAIDTVKLRGKLLASNEIKEIINEMN